MGGNHYIAVALVFVGVYLMSKSKAPRGIRNNNPLNIRENHLVDYDWVGEHPLDFDSEFEEFERPEYGLRAAARILKNYRDKYGLTNMVEIIGRWAPPSENDTESYIQSVSRSTGIPIYATLSEYDYPALMAAMIWHENGKNPYSYEQITKGFEMGFYG